MGTFDILNNISEHVTLVQIMDSLGNMNYAVNVIGKWIYDSSYRKTLALNIESLNSICSCSNEYKTCAIFKEVYYIVSYANPKAKFKCVQK